MTPMKLRLHTSILAFPFAALLAGCSDPAETNPTPEQPIDLAVKAGCNPLASSDACLFPFPNSFFTKADDKSPTGVRLNLDAQKLPLRDDKFPFDVSFYNAADGYSPVAPILLHFGVDIDTSELPGPKSLDKSQVDGSTIALYDMETGKRIIFFAEMDLYVRSEYADRAAFIIRPVEPLAMGHRHVVLIKKGLRDKDGHDIEAPAGFAALRDDKKTTNADLEAVREHYSDIFTFAEQHGYAKSDLVLAWDYPVASKEYVLGSVLSMREETLKAAGTTGLPYKITKITADPNPEIAKIVEGDFEVPTFLRDDDPNTPEREDDTFDYDENHHPVRQAKNRSYPFTMLVPKVAETMGPLPLAVLGHGIFGNGRDFLTGSGDGQAIQKLCNQYGVVAIATDWIGLSSNDLPRIAAEVAPNLDRIGIITDQLQQALINAITLTKLGKGDLKDDPQVKVGQGSLVDITKVYYWGASLGGIQGSGFISLSNDISRAIFGVPGSAWATMISRSSVFPPLLGFLEPHYPDPLDFTFGLSLVQSRFDHADPANVTKLMFEMPLPDAPKDRLVVLQVAIGDSQVPNMTSDLLARAMGVKMMTPAIYEPFGIEKVTSPTTSSAMSQYQLADYDNPLPPEGNLPPEKDNGVHHAMNFLPNVHQQIAKLWFEGQVEQFCTDACDPD